MGLELITFVGSYLLSAITTIVSERMKMTAAHNKHILMLAGLQEKSTRAARKVSDPHTKTTRRWLAIMAGTTLIVGVFIFAASGVQFVMEVEGTKSGFWPFTSDKKVTEFVTVKGIPFIKEYRYILISIFGLYFGNNHVRGN